MSTQYYVASSLDGFIAAPGNDLDWLFQFGSVDETSYPEFIREVGAIAMGSSTYEWILRHNIQPGADMPQPWSSRPLPTVEGADIRFVQGDVRPVHQAMLEAAGGKHLWIVGGGELAGQFADHGLLDELIVTVAPVTLGQGSPLLPRMISRPPLRLLSAKAVGTDYAELRYALPRS